jgi:hypothetical protein
LGSISTSRFADEPVELSLHPRNGFVTKCPIAYR